ncbi:hypothetical protein GJ496_009148 [Pomphorhynchus laevis]|nr:hypothetical protein GJ496_009148 [Pomphorhynchus laevis]
MNKSLKNDATSLYPKQENNIIEDWGSMLSISVLFNNSERTLVNIYIKPNELRRKKSKKVICKDLNKDLILVLPTWLVGDFNDNLKRNREVDSTLVKLKNCQTSYINAYFVGYKPANRSYILTQGLCRTRSHIIGICILRSKHAFEHSPVIHCSAGIGRSGTFAFVDIVLTQLAASEGCNSHVQLMNIFTIFVINVLGLFKHRSSSDSVSSQSYKRSAMSTRRSTLNGDGFVNKFPKILGLILQTGINTNWSMNPIDINALKQQHRTEVVDNAALNFLPDRKTRKLGHYVFLVCSNELLRFPKKR